MRLKYLHNNINHRRKTNTALRAPTVMHSIDRKSDQDQGVFLYSLGVRIIPIICALGGRTASWINHHANALFAVPNFLPAPKTAAETAAVSEGACEKKNKVNGRGLTDRCNPGRKIY